MIKKQRTAVAQVLLTELRLEGLRDRQLARFACDDDVPRVPQAPLTPTARSKQQTHRWDIPRNRCSTTQPEGWEFFEATISG